MNLVRNLRARGVIAAALLGLSAGGSYAADATPAPAVAPPAAGVLPGCETCPAPAPASAGCDAGCDSGCRKPLLGGLHTKTLRVPYLCPGACFGHFQTKWNRWEDVCSHYYQGINVSDAPKAPIPAAVQPPAVKPPATGPMPTPMPPPESKTPSAPLPAPSVVPGVTPPMKDVPPLPPMVPMPGSKFSQ